ncbi:hypothetical protein HMPREF0091_11203 [Fannyhessea vaginae DSM 15829]|uniref:Uncharacterized protein n=1 Tax=Fannyhessea vaginae DSM 15829 TaxID=525256 RepID=F1T6W7_9ACTN|nr:hypothetical protein HMPREF0091_11203 [Fannyhessea vaginae DSM 15829]
MPYTFKQKLTILPTKIDTLQQTPRVKAPILSINERYPYTKQQMLDIKTAALCSVCTYKKYYTY